LEIGLETLDESSQELINKPQKPEVLTSFLDAAAESGVAVVINYMTGLPGADAAAACLAWVQTHAGAEAGSQVICARMPGSANAGSLDGLDDRRQMILRLLDAGPMTISRLVHETRCLRQGFLGIELLVERQLVRFFGFTPTDALHIQGQLAMWNTDYARRYAEEGRRGFTARVSSRPTASKPASNING
jgi:hypothetical protein